MIKNKTFPQSIPIQEDHPVLHIVHILKTKQFQFSDFMNNSHKHCAITGSATETFIIVVMHVN